jgi:hypothetical protein
LSCWSLGRLKARRSRTRVGESCGLSSSSKASLIPLDAGQVWQGLVTAGCMCGQNPIRDGVPSSLLALGSPSSPPFLAASVSPSPRPPSRRQPQTGSDLTRHRYHPSIEGKVHADSINKPRNAVTLGAETHAPIGAYRLALEPVSQTPGDWFYQRFVGQRGKS